MLSLRNSRRTAWLAIFAILLNAFVPAVSHAMVACAPHGATFAHTPPVLPATAVLAGPAARVADDQPAVPQRSVWTSGHARADLAAAVRKTGANVPLIAVVMDADGQGELPHLKHYRNANRIFVFRGQERHCGSVSIHSGAG